MKRHKPQNTILRGTVTKKNRSNPTRIRNLDLETASSHNIFSPAVYIEALSLAVKIEYWTMSCPFLLSTSLSVTQDNAKGHQNKARPSCTRAISAGCLTSRPSSSRFLVKRSSSAPCVSMDDRWQTESKSNKVDRAPVLKARSVVRPADTEDTLSKLLLESKLSETTSPKSPSTFLHAIDDHAALCDILNKALDV